MWEKFGTMYIYDVENDYQVNALWYEIKWKGNKRHPILNKTRLFAVCHIQIRYLNKRLLDFASNNNFVPTSFYFAPILQLTFEKHFSNILPYKNHHFLTHSNSIWNYLK